MWLPRALLLLGLAVGARSVWETLSFAWDPAFEAPALAEGRRHPNYHAFREFTLTLGAIGVMLLAMFQPAGRRRPELWAAMLLAALFYYGGWWLPWPLLGLRTPNAVAEAVHLAAAGLALAAILLARRHFRPLPQPLTEAIPAEGLARRGGEVERGVRITGPEG